MQQIDKDPPYTPPPDLTPKGEFGWVMASLNKIENKIDGLEERLRQIEGRMNKIIGALIFAAILLTAIQAFLGIPNVSITVGAP